MIYKIIFKHKFRSDIGEHFIKCESLQECVEKASLILKKDYCPQYYNIKSIELITDNIE